MRESPAGAGNSGPGRQRSLDKAASGRRL